MAYLNLIVKGNKFEAAAAASARGIPFAFQQETKYGETVGRTPIEFESDVSDWYQLPGSLPYPVGTLLVWSRIQDAT